MFLGYCHSRSGVAKVLEVNRAMAVPMVLTVMFSLPSWAENCDAELDPPLGHQTYASS